MAADLVDLAAEDCFFHRFGAEEVIGEAEDLLAGDVGVVAVGEATEMFGAQRRMVAEQGVEHHH